MISFKNYLALVNESKLEDYPTERHFLISLGFTEANVLTPENLIRVSNIIFTVGNKNFSDLVDLSGLGLSAFARILNLQLRTAQNWYYGQRNIPQHTFLAIGYEMIGNIYAEQLGDSL